MRKSITACINAASRGSTPASIRPVRIPGRKITPTVLVVSIFACIFFNFGYACYFEIWYWCMNICTSYASCRRISCRTLPSIVVRFLLRMHRCSIWLPNLVENPHISDALRCLWRFPVFLRWVPEGPRFPTGLICLFYLSFLTILLLVALVAWSLILLLT